MALARINVPGLIVYGGSIAPGHVVPGDPVEDIAPFVVAITLILTVGGVAILRPISKRAGDLLASMYFAADVKPLRSARQ